MRQIEDLYIPPDGPLSVRPSPEIYSAMGESNIFHMIEDFYRELEISEIKHLFPQDMSAAAKRSAAFFVFLLGGPPLYHQQYGPPMMRKRHLPFLIDEKARQVWLNCFQIVLNQAEKKYNFPVEHKPGFILFLDQFSRWMINHK